MLQWKTERVTSVNVGKVAGSFSESQTKEEYKMKGWVPETDGESEGDGPIGDNPAYIDAIFMEIMERILGGPGFEKPEDAIETGEEINDRLDQIKEITGVEIPSSIPAINSDPIIDTVKGQKTTIGHVDGPDTYSQKYYVRENKVVIDSFEVEQ